MPASVRQPTVETRKPNGQRSFREVCQAAVRVFNLMDKYRTAPYPNAYAVLFAYVTGSDEALVAEINDLLQLKDQLSPYDIDSLHQEYLADSSNTYAAQDIGQAIGNEIGTVLEIIENGLKQSDDFTATLDAFADNVPKAGSEDGLAAVVTDLIEENRRMAQLTRELNSGLSKSQSLISVLNLQLEEVQNQTLKDKVTAVANRRTFDRSLEEAAAHAQKSNEGFCVVLAEIDHFESIVESHGSAVGDAVLQGFAKLSSSSLNADDMVARFGAQSFALILKGRDLTSAYNLLIKIKHAYKLSSYADVSSGASVAGVTASFGLARLEPGMSPRDALRQAETYVQSSQAAGGNTVKARGFS